MKSLKSKEFSFILRASSSACFSSYSCWAFSMRVIMSPMPKIRLAIRSGWKTSRSVSFSPVPVNLIGAPVTWRMDKAAPPRVSPSNLVITTPVMPNCWLKLSATFTASCPVMASTTKRISFGSAISLISFNSVIKTSSICKRPAVSIKT